MVESDVINIKFDKKNVINFFKNSKVQIVLTIIVFLAILFFSMHIRLAGVPNLIDKTTGHYLMADPDAFYEFRVAQTIVNGGDMNSIDTMRNPGLNLTFAKEMLPYVLAYSYKVFHSFNKSITLDYIDVVYPIYAFGAGLIIFFALCWYLSRSKVFAILSSAMLAFSATYFQRTGAGISSHESLGMVFFFLALLIYAISLENFKKGWKWFLGLGIASGISLALSFASWSGGSTFVVMIFGLSSFIFYLFGTENMESKKRFIFFNIIWIVFAILFMPLLNYSFHDMYSKFLSNYGVIIPFSLVFMIVDFLLEKYIHKIKFVQSKYRFLYSILGTILVGILGLILIGKNPITLLLNIYSQLLYPLGRDRASLTVAYYAQPYLTDLMNNVTSIIFWLFLLGIVFMGIEFSKNISNGKNKIYFNIAWILSIFGMLFSRFSSSSIFNGTNFISQSVYIISFLIFAVYFGWICINDKFNVSSRDVFLFSWMFIMLLSTRSAIRVMFIIVTFVFVSASFAVIKAYEYSKKTKDETFKYLGYTISLISLLIILVFLFGNPITHTTGNYQATSYYASNTGPLTNNQWQYSMEWVRNNTASDAVFVHWWDYGYLVQTLGNRTTLLDGGNINVFWDYMVGRYILTEPNENASLSFMKSHNVSYLLIDPTDIGKYPAYAKIGSDNNWDRYSSIPVIFSDNRQQIEKANQTTFVYTGQSFVDKDIIYKGIFLPGPTYDEVGNAAYHSYIIGVLLNVSRVNNEQKIQQPAGVFYYNGKQYVLPLRYVYVAGKLMDFKSGINNTFIVIPQVLQANSQIQIDQFGAGIYLSEKTGDSLFAQLYLMEDYSNKYPTIELAHKEDDYVVKILKQQGANVGSFVYFNGLRAPLNIWQVNYPSNIQSNSEFLRPSGGYGEFDNLTFIK